MTPAADEPFVSGPHLVREVHPDMDTALGTLWVAVTRAGGAVGFAPDAPEADIRAAAVQAVEDVRAKRQQLIVIGADHTLAGTVFLRTGVGVQAHRADVLRLMVRPDLQGRGWGRTLLDAAVAHATALGLEQLMLSTRGGTDVAGFYLRRGFTEVGVWPETLRLGPDDLRDEHWFQLRLR
ncbi:GNAT family N-acetyltransferase [Pseudonocardia xinjiangensis]|uniref:GNAT family N-acetyltransferase n=1 Tax=Pseudonocardia xinjiangensis TaxID=75289 RepID=UPI003D8F259A